MEITKDNTAPMEIPEDRGEDESVNEGMLWIGAGVNVDIRVLVGWDTKAAANVAFIVAVAIGVAVGGGSTI